MTPRVAELLKTGGAIPDITPATKITALKVSTTTWEGGSLVSLLFVNGSDAPRYVLRLPRIPSRDDRLARNYHALEELHRRRIHTESVPAPVYRAQFDDVMGTVETFLPGASLFKALSDARRDGDDNRAGNLLQAAYHWVWGVHASTWEMDLGGPLALNSGERPIAPNSGGSPLAPNSGGIESEEDWGTDLQVLTEAGLDSAALDRLRDEFATLPSLAPLRAWCHGDFNPNNVLMDHGEVSGVVDWEYAGPGIAVYDLFTMMRIACLPASESATGLSDSLSRIWTGATAEGRAFTRALDRYAARPGIARRALRSLFNAYLVRQSAAYLRASDDPRDPSVRPWLNFLAQNPRPARPRRAS